MPASRSPRNRTSQVPGVETWLTTLQHPWPQDVQALRRLILSTDPAIGEAIKWNAPSFHARGHFATMRLNGRPPLQLILHLDTKPGRSIAREAVADPDHLLCWLAADRACIDFSEAGAVERHGQALQAILRRWLAQLA